MKLIDGKAISALVLEECEIRAGRLKGEGISPCLAVMLVGEDPASRVYVKNKEKACARTGIASIRKEFPDTVSMREVLNQIDSWNNDPGISGILVQMPLPAHIDAGAVVRAIDPLKDVDGFHPMNVGINRVGGGGLVSCTPAGIMELLSRSGISVDGKECVVVGRSNIVGKPMARLLLEANGTVTVCHSHTAELKAVTGRADILVAAMGKPKYITAEYVKEGAVVIDVGIHRNPEGKLCGDVDFAAVAEKCSAITPVPGGVGPMTIAMLMKNCLEAALLQKGKTGIS